MTKDDDTLPITSSSSSTSSKKEIDGGAVSLLGKGRYKLWALGAIILLAFWSMFAGTVTLRWSAGNLNRIGDDDSLDSPLRDDLDVLFRFPTVVTFGACARNSFHVVPREMEEREKVVRYMWDVYTNGRRIRLPKFWQEAFEAAYEDITSDVPGVREAAITEIAKMSIRSVELDPPTVQLTDTWRLTFHLRNEKSEEVLVYGSGADFFWRLVAGGFAQLFRGIVNTENDKAPFAGALSF
ncbi:hypothetical protein AKJ16_DCAP11900 [Drosera capensis]